MKKRYFAMGITILMLICFCCGAVEGIVNASSWLNARVFPELKSPVAVKLPRGKKVEIFKRHGAWLEIAAPDITPVYAAAAFINGDTVTRDMNLRIKPEGKAAVIARIKRGTKLKAVSEPNRYGWVQVAPLSDMRLYVMRDYVTYDAAQVPVAATGATAAAAPEKKEEAAPAPARKEAAPVKKEEAAPAKKETAPVKKEEAAPAPAPVKKEVAPAPAPVKKEEAAPAKKEAAPAKKEAAPAKKEAAPAPVKKEEAAPARKEAVSFELLPQRKRELINIGADITKFSEFQKSGRLEAVFNPNSDCTTYALVDTAARQNLGFIFAEAPINLTEMLNKKVTVKGYAYKVSGWKSSVVCATEIKVIGE